mgnify:CR=1 FL=1
MYTIIYDGGYLNAQLYEDITPCWISSNPQEGGIVRNNIIKTFKSYIEKLEKGKFIDYHYHWILKTARVCKCHMGIEKISFEKQYMVADLLDEKWRARYDAIIEKFKEEV